MVLQSEQQEPQEALHRDVKCCTERLLAQMNVQKRLIDQQMLQRGKAEEKMRQLSARTATSQDTRKKALCAQRGDAAKRQEHVEEVQVLQEQKLAQKRERDQQRHNDKVSNFAWRKQEEKAMLLERGKQREAQLQRMATQAQEQEEHRRALLEEKARMREQRRDMNLVSAESVRKIEARRLQVERAKWEEQSVKNKEEYERQLFAKAYRVQDKLERSEVKQQQKQSLREQQAAMRQHFERKAAELRELFNRYMANDGRPGVQRELDAVRTELENLQLNPGASSALFTPPLRAASTPCTRQATPRRSFNGGATSPRQRSSPRRMQQQPNKRGGEVSPRKPLDPFSSPGSTLSTAAPSLGSPLASTWGSPEATLHPDMR